jgi:hydrogenase-4 component B
MFGMGAVAICGLPPLNGFVSEWLVYLGMMDAAAGKGHAAWATMPAMILMATAGAVALACFVKACAMIFLGAPRTQQAARAHECGVWMRGPMLGLAGLCVAIAIAPMVFWPAIARAVGSWHPAWGEIQAPGSLGRLGAMQVVLVMLFAAAGAGLWAKVRGNGLRRGLTWDCAYEAPTARMQYTGGSFAGIVAGWFEWALCPERKLRRPRGIFPVEAIRLERVPEMVLERIIGPVGVAVMLVSTGVRRLQHGRLQFYILYVVGALIALGVLVSMGGAR